MHLNCASLNVKKKSGKFGRVYAYWFMNWRQQQFMKLEVKLIRLQTYNEVKSEKSRTKTDSTLAIRVRAVLMHQSFADRIVEN